MLRNRHHRLRRWAATLSLTSLLFSLAMPGAGAAPEAKQPIALEKLVAQNNKVTLMVELPSAPLAAMQDGPQSVKHAQALKVEHEQFQMHLGKERIEHRVLSSHTKLFNGITLEVKATDVAKVAALPGVQRLHVDRPHKLPEPQLASSVEMINALEVRTGAPGQPGIDGTGVTVAVIDTGIDYTHPDLGGCFGQGCRVVAGYDFVGDDFDGTNAPVPDADPMDIYGHGTHVAGIIGALAAEAEGVTGVAPGVQFAALKIFGTEGYTWDHIIIQALEMAWDLRVDVVNMSLGDSYSWPEDPSAQAAKWLSERGVVVVASAGNEGQAGEYSTGSPSVGSGSIAVASFENNMATRNGFLDPEGMPMGYGVMAYAPAPPASGPSAEVVYAGLGTSDADFLNPDGSSKVAGKIALISRGAITFREKSMRAQAHGAVQVIIHNSQPGFFSGTMGQAGDYIPTLSISRSDGLRLLSLIEQGPVSLTWTGQLYKFTNETAGLISSFSSWGPSPDLALKPDLTAPGGSIYSTYPMAQGGYASLSGTSMSAPHVAGAAALIVQAKADELVHMGPKDRVETVRALLMNNALPRTMGAGSDLLYPVHRQGAGMIDVFKAINAGQRITPDKLSLGEMEGVSSVERRVTVKNTGSETQFYSFELIGEGATLASSPGVLRLRPGQHSQVRLTIHLDENLTDGLFYGWVAMRDNSGERVAHVPYIGYKGDYQADPALDPLDYDLPWLAELGADGYLYPVEEMDLSPNCGCEQSVAYVVFSLARQAQELRVEIIDMQTGRRLGHAFRADYYAHSGGGIDYTIFDGTNDTGRQLPAGTYQLQLKALRPLGDKHNPAHWDVWMSGPVNLHWD